MSIPKPSTVYKTKLDLIDAFQFRGTNWECPDWFIRQLSERTVIQEWTGNLVLIQQGRERKIVRHGEWIGQLPDGVVIVLSEFQMESLYQQIGNA